MKRTTYIIVGVLLAGLVVMSGIIFYMSTCVITWEDAIYGIEGKQKTVQLPECRSVKFVMNGEIKSDRQVSFSYLPLNICPTDSATGSLTFAANLEKFITMRNSNDTLYVEFKFNNEDLESPYNELGWLCIRSATMQLNLPADVQRLSVDLRDMIGTLSGFRRDTLSVWMQGCVLFNDCKIASLNAEGGKVHINSGEIDNLYMNLDNVRTWSVNTDSCSVGTEYLSGSRDHTSAFQKGECKQVVWTPLDADAALNLKINYAARIEVNE